MEFFLLFYIVINYSFECQHTVFRGRILLEKCRKLFKKKLIVKRERNVFNHLKLY